MPEDRPSILIKGPGSGMLIRRPKKRETIVASAETPSSRQIPEMSVVEPKRSKGQKMPVTLGGKPRVSGHAMAWKDPDRTDHAIFESSLGTSYSIRIPGEAEKVEMNKEAKRLDEEFQKSLRIKAKKRK